MDFIWTFLDSNPFLLPVVIFFGRIMDVSLGTLRVVFIGKGQKKIASLMGFVEVFIWIIIISEILTRANDLVSYLSYAAGYAAGVYVGLLLEERIAFGFVSCRIYTTNKGAELMELLKKQEFGATILQGKGSFGKEVSIIETVVDRKRLDDAMKIIEGIDEKVFIVVNDIRDKYSGYFRRTNRNPFHGFLK